METNKPKQFFKNHYVQYALVLAAGLFFGWLMFGNHSGSHPQKQPGEKSGETWTCSMHPQIRQDKPGKCPICGMDLIPVKAPSVTTDAVDPGAIQLSEEAIALANIQTTKVSRQNPVKDIRLYGTIQADERLSQSQTSHINGRIEKLLVNFTGESVKQGQAIATIYSPELLSAQQELLEAAKMQSIQPALLEAAREKLRHWKLTEDQISAMERSGNVSPLVEIKANTSGIVVGKKVNQGDYVSQGTVLFEIANLSQVWAVFDAYEADLPFLKVGDPLKFTLQALPGKIFSGRISFINPILDPVSRTAKIRVEMANGGAQLKPEMYANAIIQAPLKQYKKEIVIPKSAVLWTGKRSIVYVKQADAESPVFALQEIELGPSLGESYLVVSGINEGDEIVTNGVFSIDASAQLEGKRSMMNMQTVAFEPGQEEHAMSGKDPQQSKPAKKEHAMIKVQGNCEMCKERIEGAAKKVQGVSSADWDVKTKLLHLNFDPSLTSTDAISKAIAKVGHDTEKYKADCKVYDALPACCKYRE